MSGCGELELVENPNVPVFYADDIESVQIVGGRARIVYIEVREMGGRPVKWPVVEMIRPIETVASNKLVMMVAQAMKRAASNLGAFFELH